MPVVLEDYTARFPEFKPALLSVFMEPPAPARQPFAVRTSCPHCQQPVDLHGEPPGDQVVCSLCGASFPLNRDVTLSWAATELPQLGKFKLLGKLGGGAFGTVYRALDTALHRDVAVKVLHAAGEDLSADHDATVLER